jgi:Tfp pilus assembly pilus retraction ATPase PilT
MEEIVIYKFQLETIIEALRITSNIHASNKGITCHDRQVRQAYQYAKNAMAGQKDIEVPYLKTNDSQHNTEAIASDNFQRELQEAIESGKDFSFEYNGEDEVTVDIFHSGAALKSVLECLKKHLKI